MSGNHGWALWPPLVVVLAWAVVAVAGAIDHAGMGVVGGLALIGVTGWLAERLGSGRRDLVERWSVGLSLALIAAIGATLLAGATWSTSRSGLLAAVALEQVVLLALGRRRPVDPAHRLAGHGWVRNGSLGWLGTARRQPGRLAAGMLAAAVAGGLVWASVSVTLASDRELDVVARTVVTLVPVESSLVAARPDAAPWIASHELTVTNREGTDVVYELEITRPGAPPVTDSVEVADGETWSRPIDADQPGAVIVRIWGGTTPQSGTYREVRTGVRG
ncbi:MAG: hypothetical protein ACK5OX_19195 [Desertimonas sp.]